MKLSAFGISDVGRRREKNEDSILVDESLDLFVVADGMGGHLGGEFASRMTIETIQEVFRKLDEDDGEEGTQFEGTIDDVLDLGKRLQLAIRTASIRVFDEAHRNEKLKGMGTTAVGLAFEDDMVHIGHVGDSRAYLVRDGEIKQLTEDHSLVSEQLRAGFITEETARTHKLKNIITRSVGFQREVDADLSTLKINKGDLFVICSDGLSNLVSDDLMLKLANQDKSVAERCEDLVQAANDRGGDDNVSVILIAVESL